MNRKARVKRAAWLWVFVAVLLVLAGCSPAPSAPSTGQTPEAGETAAPQLPDTGANTVPVELEEFVITMPASLPAGPTVFEIANVGTEEHSFEIEGQGIEAGLDQHLQPGETATLEVDLAPGTYTVYCPVEDHADEGMRMDLTVTAP
jgi:uncharacterized cupredoxin-like copper-binding protein